MTAAPPTPILRRPFAHWAALSVVLIFIGSVLSLYAAIFLADLL